MSTELQPATDHTVPIAAYSVEGFAKAHSISRAQAWVLIQRGDLATVKMGRRRLITAAEATRWLNSLHAVVMQ